VAVEEWAVDKLGRSEAKRQGKESVKKMEGMFDDIAKDSDQSLIMTAHGVTQLEHPCHGIVQRSRLALHLRQLVLIQPRRSPQLHCRD
jgi:hypothetical protein